MKLLSSRHRSRSDERRPGPRRYRTISTKRGNRTSEERWTRLRTESGTRESHPLLPWKIPRGNTPTVKSLIIWCPQKKVHLVRVPPVPEAPFLQKELVQEVGLEEATIRGEAGGGGGGEGEGEGEAGVEGAAIILASVAYPLPRRMNLQETVRERSRLSMQLFQHRHSRLSLFPSMSCLIYHVCQNTCYDMSNTVMAIYAEAIDAECLRSTEPALLLSLF